MRIPSIPERLTKAYLNDALVHNYFHVPDLPYGERLESLVEAMAERHEVMVKKMVHLVSHQTIPPMNGPDYQEFIR